MTFATVVTAARSEGRTLLNEVEAKEILADAGVPVSRTVLATSAEEAVAEAEKLGFPVVLKIVSPDIAHKSDVGGVMLNLLTREGVARAYAAIEANAKAEAPEARITGVSVQRMAAPGGIEVIVGLTTDPQFGHVVMFGLGGILVEVLKDVSFRIVPLEAADAEAMVSEIQAAEVLRGVRGRPPSDLEALRDAILAVSRFAEGNPGVREIDLNPMLVYPDGALAVDARIVVTEEAS